ncbi:hypothetical protein [Streptomyces sp. TE33382]
MKMRTSLTAMASAALLGALALSGCSQGAEGKGAVPEDLPRCEQILGKQNVRDAVEVMGKGDLVVNARLPAKKLAALLSRESKASDAEDLLHHSYRACRVTMLEREEGGAVVVEATVKWSVLLLDGMTEPKYAETWRKVNEQVFVETRRNGSGMRLLVACGLQGAADGQLRAPLEMEVSDPGFDPALRGKLLTTFARSLTDALACTNVPEIPLALSE